MLTIDRKQFNENIIEIHRKSESLNDSWKLLEYDELENLVKKFESPSPQTEKQTDRQPILYLEKTVQQINATATGDEQQQQLNVENESSSSGCILNLITFVYHVIYSESYAVPVLYLNAYKSNGKCLSFDELYEHFELTNEKSDGFKAEQQMIITQQEHPFLFNKPFYFLHPCKTSKWMHDTVPMPTNGDGDGDDDNEPRKMTATNYTLKWLSFTFSALNIHLDIKYSLLK
jgi:ubiquitin-like-conjugating enzyme ATG10